MLLLIAAARADAAGRVIYVDADAVGPSDGTSWAAGYRSLQDALADAQRGDEIWVASGIYRPDQGADRVPGDRTAAFQLADGVAVKGGYAGFGEPDPDARDIGLYQTILSGDLNRDDGPGFAGNSENSYHVATGSGTGATALMDGFTITGGNANDRYPNNRGGGMYNSAGNPTVTNCTFVGSVAGAGGGIANDDGGSPRLTECLITENRAESGGGGMSNADSGSVLNNCTFSRNSARTGGGMSNLSGSSPTITGCRFSGNLAYDYGGGIYSTSSSPVITNCTFTGNRTRNGNALAFYGLRSTIELTNCILWDGGSEIKNYNSSTITVSYSNVQGGWPGDGNIDADPLFADSGYWDLNGTPEDASDDFWVDGDYHLQSRIGRWDPDAQTWVQDQVSSPCIDAGDPVSPVGYEPFPGGGRINMGVYGGTQQASLSPDEADSAGVLAQASNPGPADQAVDVRLFPKLSWTGDPGSVVYHVYFGTDVQPPFAGSDVLPEFSPGGLAPYTMYYWRVDELDRQARKTIGQIWTFVVGPPALEAYDPYPLDGAAMVSPDPILSWTPGFNSISHEVYFGTTNPPPFIRNQTETEFDPGLLEKGVMYYWRIGEISTAGTAIGPVWTFTTGPVPNPSPKGRTCFTGETGVWLDGVLVPISKAMRGGRVGRAAGDLLSSLPCLGEVDTVQLHAGTFTCCDVLLESGNRISVVENHYFLADSGQWISLQDLKEGMRLQTAKGPIAITAVVKRATPYAGEVYNLKVNGSHRYLVGQDAIIVRDY